METRTLLAAAGLLVSLASTAASAATPIDNLSDPFPLLAQAKTLVAGALPSPSVYLIDTSAPDIQLDPYCPGLPWHFDFFDGTANASAVVTFYQSSESHGCVVSYRATIDKAPGYFPTGAGAIETQFPDFAKLTKAAKDAVGGKKFVVDSVSFEGPAVVPDPLPDHVTFTGQVCGKDATVAINLADQSLMSDASTIPTCQ